MFRLIKVFILVFLSINISALGFPQTSKAHRPAITGIAYVRYFTSDQQASRHYYEKLLGLQHLAKHGMDIYVVSQRQCIEIKLRPKTDTSPIFLEQVAFETENVPAMRSYLKQNGIRSFKKEPGGFSFVGPEGHRIAFVKPQKNPGNFTGHEVSRRIIHAGFIVQDLKSEDAFFQDILEFKPYWTGGPNNTTAYASFQAPEKHEWIEFMLTGGSTQKAIGGKNHVALGVENIRVAYSRLKANGWTGEAQPKQGLDGKWQINIFDPDQTRIELMEFAPSVAPCCTEYKQPHPTPTDN